MQNRYFILLIAVLPMVMFQSCTEIMCIVSGYKPGEIKNSCQTPEPGTELSPRCNLILKHAALYAINPDSVWDSKSKYLELMKPRVKHFEDIHLPVDTAEILVRLYCNVSQKKREDLPVLIYYHGGGFIWGSIDIFDNYCRKLARETDALLLSVDYRLAPEYKYPVALRDCYAVLEWAEANIESYGGDPQKLIIMGESAGGNLAAVMPLVSRDSCGPSIDAQIIVCGATTFEEIVFPSRLNFLRKGRTYFVSEDYLHRCKSAYVPDSVDISHPYISPLEADLNKDMPSAMVITAQVDPLRDEGRAYARKMEEAGMDVVYREYPGMIHAFMNFYPFLPDAREAIDDVAEFIDRVSAGNHSK